MIKAYFRCPDAQVTVHRNPNCSQAQAGPERSQRHVMLNADTVSRELKRFRANAYPLAAAPGTSDLWLILDFFDTAFEEALVAHLKRLLGPHCAPLRDCAISVHC